MASDFLDEIGWLLRTTNPHSMKRLCRLTRKCKTRANKMGLTVGSPLPSFDGATAWLNPTAEPTKNGAVAPSGGLVLVHFWAKSCPSCHANMPHVQQLRDKYGPIRFSAYCVFKFGKIGQRVYH